MSERDTSEIMLSAVQKEYMELAKERVRRIHGNAVYVVPTDDGSERILEVHRHRGRHDENNSTPIYIATIDATRDSGAERDFRFIQRGVQVLGNSPMPFGHEGRAIQLPKRFLNLTPRLPVPLCMPNLFAAGIRADAQVHAVPSPSDEQLQEHIDLMKRVGHHDKVIRFTVFQSHRGKTKKEIKKARKTGKL